MTTAAEFEPITGPALVGAGLIGRAAAMLQELGPYLAIELILPGGTLLALLLWLCRHYQNAATHGDRDSGGNLTALLRRIASRLSPRPLHSIPRRLRPHPHGIFLAKNTHFPWASHNSCSVTVRTRASTSHGVCPRLFGCASLK